MDFFLGPNPFITSQQKLKNWQCLVPQIFMILMVESHFMINPTARALGL